jgi:hypothetical protein
MPLSGGVTCAFVLSIGYYRFSDIRASVVINPSRRWPCLRFDTMSEVFPLLERTLGSDDAHISVERSFDCRDTEEEERIESLLDFGDATILGPGLATSHPATALENLHPLQYSRLHQRAHLPSTLTFLVTLLEEISHPLLLHAVAECLRIRQLRQTKEATNNLGWKKGIYDFAQRLVLGS